MGQILSDDVTKLMQTINMYVDERDEARNILRALVDGKLKPEQVQVQENWAIKVL